MKTVLTKRLKPGLKLAFVAYTIITLACSIFIFIPLFLLDGYLFLRIFDLCVTLLVFITGVYSIFFALCTRLVFTGYQISFRMPLHSIECTWDQITGVLYTKKELELVVGDDVIVKWGVLHRFLMLRKRKTIPLHIFVERWDKERYWNRNELLMFISELRPMMKENILKNI